MIVNDLDLLRSVIRPSKYDPPLVIYPDRVLAREVTPQSLQAVSRRCSEIANHGGIVELHQLAASYLGYVCRKPLWNPSLLENQLGERSTSRVGVKFAMVRR